VSDQPDPLATVRAALDHVDDIGPARGLVALRNAAPAIADLCREVEAARDRIATLEAELAQAIAAVRPDLAQFLKATEE
jgi:hypothetical protein